MDINMDKHKISVLIKALFGKENHNRIEYKATIHKKDSYVINSKYGRFFFGSTDIKTKGMEMPKLFDPEAKLTIEEEKEKIGLYLDNVEEFEVLVKVINACVTKQKSSFLFDHLMICYPNQKRAIKSIL